MTDSKKKKIIIWFWILFAIPVLTVVFTIGYVLTFSDIPSFKELENPESNLATLVLADDGTVLSTFHVENRSYVTYDQLSPNLVKALIATEDVRFHQHSGIDFRSLARVVVKTMLGGDSSQGGGSTITQQLAKTLFDRPDMSKMGKIKKARTMLETKLKEWAIAVKLERSYTKEEIITMYLNEVEFGSNSFGIKAAARTFFAKEPADLTIEESATLVGMLNKTDRYNPKRNYDKSMERRNFVISQMNKYGYISKHDCDSIRQLPIDLSSYQVQNHNAGSALYFRDMLSRIMSASEPKRSSYRFYEDYVVDSLLWADDPLYGWLNKNLKPDGTKYNIYKDGLRIHTTINPKMQRYAEEAVREHIGGDMQKRFEKELKWKNIPPFANDVPKNMINSVMNMARKDSDRYRNMKKAGKNEKEIFKTFSEKQQMRVFAWNDEGYVDTLMTPDDSIRYYKSHMRASFIAMTPKTGHIKAYVGGPDYRYFKFDNARQSKRQIGSTIKPFLYTLAMQEGMSPCDQVANVPQTFINYDGSAWTPNSTDRDEYIGNIVTLKWGLAKSSNNISAYLMKQYGPEAMVEMMRKMGVGSFLDPVPPLCVGAANISLYEMVAAYNTFPSKGVYVRPMFVTRIEDNMGNVLARFSTVQKEAISEQTAYLMANLMQGVVNGGTGYALRSRFGFTGEIGGKTGTTNNNADGWFIGYTPELTAGAWAGFENEQIHFNRTGDGGGSGAALPIWGKFLQKVQKDPSLVRYCDKTVFDMPAAGFSMDLSCTGNDTSSSEGVKDEYEEEQEMYFE